jgi:hypothetical protein
VSAAACQSVRAMVLPPIWAAAAGTGDLQWSGLELSACKRSGDLGVISFFLRAFLQDGWDSCLLYSFV